jgi:hypothetical protein
LVSTSSQLYGLSKIIVVDNAQASSLNFQLLDDIQSLAVSDFHRELSGMSVDDLGPAFELYFLNKESVASIFAVPRPSAMSKISNALDHVKMFA